VENPALLTGIEKLAVAGERAGFTVEQMIRILNAGVSVDTLLRLIAERLGERIEDPPAHAFPRWVV